MEYPVDTVREQFPSLQRRYHDRQVIYFDGPSGSQVVESSITAMVSYMEQGSANLGGSYLTSMESDQIVAEARTAMADFMGGDPSEIAFGMNMTTLTFAISQAMAKDWDEQDTIVVTELDHRANVDTWVTAAEEAGASVNWIPLDTDTCTLDYSDLDNIITDNTPVVAIGHASNGLGTVNQLEPVVERAREVGAYVVVDAVHSAPHLFIDRDDLGADIVLCSAYKFFGPHIGVASIQSDLFKQLDAYRISTAPATMPGKLETGTQSIEGLAGIRGAVDFIASLGEGDTRRARIKSAFDRIHQHEQRLANRIRDYLGDRDDVTVYQTAGKKTPTIAFTVDGNDPVEIVKHLDSFAIFSGAGHFYASTIADRFGLDNGWVRIGMAPYSTDDEVDRFIAAMDDL